MSDLIVPTVLGLLAYAIPLSIPALRRERCTVLTLVGCMTLIQALAVVNVMLGGLPGGGKDSETFVRKALEISAGNSELPGFSIGVDAYMVYLYGVGHFLSLQPMVLSYSSIIPASVNLTLLVMVAARAGTNRLARCVTLLLIGLSPGFLLYSSLVTREPLELMSLLAYLACVIDRSDARRAIMAAPLLLPAMLIHPALFVYAFCLVGGICLLSWINGDRRLTVGGLTVLGAVVATLWAAAALIPLWYGETFIVLMKKGLFEAVAEYRRPIELANPDTAYDLALSFQTTAEAAGSLVRNYVYYLFGPLIGFRLTMEYVVMAWEASVRLLGIASIIALFVSRRFTIKMTILACYYFSLTFMWSIASTNNGQAFRHHMLTQWVMIIFIVLACNWAREHFLATSRK